MIKEIIDCIPSETMRAYLSEHPMELSVLQQATIVSEYASKSQKLALFEKLIKITDIDTEKLLLENAIKDTKKYGYPSKRTDKVYDKYFSRAEKLPSFPFLEICNLPVLFEVGDVICERETYYYVASAPKLNNSSDFTDECYLCYSLANEIKNGDDLFYAHNHIHVCVAEAVSFENLSEEQKRVKESVVRLLSS